MGKLSRRERDKLASLVAPAIVIALIIAVGVAVFILVQSFSNSDQDPMASHEEISDIEDSPLPPLEGNTVEGSNESKVSKSVSNNTLDRLNQGTILSFGDSRSPKEVSIIADPSDLGQDGNVLGQSMLDAVDNGDLRLNLYPVAGKESHETGTDSLIRVATCLIGSDENDKNTNTLQSIIATANNFGGQEDIVAMSEKMGTGTDIECPDTAVDSSVATANNGQHFMTHFKMEEPGAVITNRGAVTDLSLLNDDWLVAALDNRSVEHMVN